ncbi:hypothetical protein JET64_22920 [Pseudomonas putida]|nr:hypothetical protein [Pseudomonas putida]
MLCEALEIVEGEQDIGLFLSAEGRPLLKVPHGLDCSGLSPTAVFSLLYRMFAVFRRTGHGERIMAARDGVERHGKGGAQAAGKGAGFVDMLAFDELFDEVDPRSIVSLHAHPGMTSAQDVQRLDRHLSRALFDEGDIPYLDRVPGMRRTMGLGKQAIVGLYCFLARDFYQHLLQVDLQCAWGSFFRDGIALAEDFQHRYLATDDSLYLGDAEQIKHCRERLSHLLWRIDRQATPRDATYCRLHDALARYLQGASSVEQAPGLVWGVQGFWAVWESMCLCHALAENADTTIHNCDFEHLPRGVCGPRDMARWQGAQRLVFSRNHLHRRPDLVVNAGERWRVVDFKYYPQPLWQRPKEKEDEPPTKEERDFTNLEIYALLLRCHLSATASGEPPIALEMWLPGRAFEVHALQATPAWDPPLSVHLLQTSVLLERYASLYQSMALRSEGAVFNRRSPAPVP